jgi:hypothetical protein
MSGWTETKMRGLLFHVLKKENKSGFFNEKKN